GNSERASQNRSLRKTTLRLNATRAAERARSRDGQTLRRPRGGTCGRVGRTGRGYPRPVIVGRDAEVAEVAAALTRAGLVVWAGGPGAGKSTVAGAALAVAGRAVLAGGGLATLRQVPGLALSRAVRVRLPTDDPALAAEAVRARLGPAVLLLDDVHWADRLTLEVLPELARRCRVLTTLRTPAPLSTAALDRLRRAATCWLDLGPLAADAAAALARAVWAERGIEADEAALPRPLNPAARTPPPTPPPPPLRPTHP